MTFGVTTFKERFESHFRPLMEQLSGHTVIAAVNASAKTGLDDDYRSAMLSEMAFHPNASVVMYQQMRGLAKMWNDLIIHSPTDAIIILNDDVSVLDPSALIDACTRHINSTRGMLLINGSFSHFCITKQMAIDIGWFDERLLGFGEEDGDFVHRYNTMFGEPVISMSCPHIRNHSSSIRDEGVKAGVGKYTRFNREFIFRGINGNPAKYHVVKNGFRGMFSAPMDKRLTDEAQYPYEAFFMEHRDSL